MARVLVLGGTSYVAQFLLQRVLQDDALQVVNREQLEEISAVACTIRGAPFSPLPAGFVTAGSEPSGRAVRVYWQVDILDEEALEKCVQDFHPTVVINCTAMSSPAVCQKEPSKACTVNEPQGVVTLLEKLPWRTRFVHFSTDFVYEGTQAWGESYEEDAAVLSTQLSVYGSSKLRFDQFLLSRERSANLEVLVLRIANVVGPAAPVFVDKSAPKFMQWLHQQLFQPETAEVPLKLWSDEYRSYLYIHDLVSVLFKLLAIHANASATLVNLGGEEALSRVELARRYIAACAKHHAGTVATVTREIEPTARARVDLGYPSPLNTKLSTARLAHLLPDSEWTPTSQILDEISRSFLA